MNKFRERYHFSLAILQTQLSLLFVRGIILCALFYLCINTAYTQQNTTVDSLLNLLSEPSIDSSIINSQIASEYYSLGEYSLSAEHYTIALNGYIAKSDTAKTAPLIAGLGNLYLQHNKDYKKAQEYYEKALSIYTNTHNKRGMALMYNNIGTCYLEMNEYDLAINELSKSYELKLELNDSTSIHTTLNNIGVLHFKQGRYSQSIDFYNQSLEANKTNLWSYSNTLNNLAELYIETNEYEKVESNLTEALKISQENSFTFITKENFALWTELYSKQNDIVQLRKYNKLFLSVGDTLYNNKKLLLLTEIQTKYETEEKERENSLLLIEKELQHQKLMIQNNKIIALAVIMSLISASAILFLFLYRNQRKSNNLLVRKNSENIEREKKLSILLSKEKNTAVPTEIKYLNSALKKEEKQALINAIEDIIRNKKYHLVSGFSLADLAKKVNASRNIVSQVINENYNCNFNTLINNYRIKEAAILFADPKYKNYTIEAISHQVGYKSKSTFNKAFMQFVGVTPSFYLKTINETKK